MPGRLVRGRKIGTIPEFKTLEEEKEYWESRGPLAEGKKGKVDRPRAGQKRSSLLAVRNKPRIFFGCAMLGGYPNVSREVLAEFPGIIRSLGYELISDHQTRPGVIEEEASMDPAYIHDRDYAWLMEADGGVFEISNPSLGVGGEISDLIHLGKPVLLLYREGLEARVSAYTCGKCNSRYVKSPVVCQPYPGLAGARARIEEFVRAYMSSTL